MKASLVCRTLWVLGLFLGLLNTAHPENEQWVKSLQGAAIAQNAVVRVHDPELNFVLANAGTYTDRFVYNKAQAAVVLRFDDSQRDLFTTNWSLFVNYTITTRSVTGQINTLTNQQLTINYTVNGGTYTDITEKYYDDVVWASVKVTSVTANNVTNAQSAFPNNIYLDLRLDIDRRYVLNTTEFPQVNRRAQQGTYLDVNWSYVEGAASYDFEWLYVEVPDNPNAADEFYGSGYTYDMKNATRVNTTFNHYEIPLAYSQGIILWRVRGVGVDAQGERLEGTWTFPSTEVGNTNNVSVASYHRWTLDDNLESTFNWQYTGSYAENGRHKDLFTFFDGGQKERQSMTVLNTDHLSLIDHKIYDFLCRPAVQLMPYPTTGTDFGFHASQAPGYDYSSFDTDNTLNAPDAFPDNGPGHYYGSTNTGLGVHGDLAPDAQDYPYTRTQFMNDGSGRVRTEAGPGPDHNMASAHTTRHVYGAPGSQFELDRLFGSEVGYVEHYKKNLTIDPNGVTSVSYVDPFGRTIATALAGASSASPALEDVDGYADTEVDIPNAPIPSSFNNDHTQWYTSKVITVDATSDYHFNYSLTGAAYNDCVNGPCVYDLTIRILDDCGAEIDINPDANLTSFSSPAQGIQSQSGFTFSATLDPGSYTIEKVLSLHAGSEQAYHDAFIAHDPPCIDLVEPEPVPCAPDCQTLCEQAYTTVLEGVEWYLDGYGVPVSTTDQNDPNYNSGAASTALTAIAQCVQNCNDPGIPTPCELKRAMLIADMSKDGQYFENLPHAFDTDYDANGWLEANNDLAAYPAALTNNTQWTTWDEIRDHWDPIWGQDLLPFHPEYCQYQFYCETTCGLPPYPSTTFVTDPFYGDYYAGMYAATNVTPASTDPPLHYLNPLGLPTVSGLTDPQYQPVSSSLDNDALLNCWLEDERIGECAEIPSSTIANGLKHFFPVNGIDGQLGYYSIWAVIFDPANISNGHGALTPAYSTAVQDFFDVFWGVTTNDPGALLSYTPGPGQVTPYQFFRSVYDFYRELYAYSIFQNGCTDATQGCGGFLADEDHNGTDANGFLIRYPHAAIFDAFPAFLSDPQYFVETLIPNTGLSPCHDACAAAADDWIAQIQDCITPLPTGVTMDCVRETLIEICSRGCDLDHMQGSSEGDGTTVYGCMENGSFTPAFSTFQDVLDHYGNGCGPLVWPPPAQATEGLECHCDNLRAILAQLGIEDDGSYSTEELEQIAAVIDDLHMPDDTYELDQYGSVNLNTLSQWLGGCDDPGSTSEDELLNGWYFPLALRCTPIDLSTDDCAQAAQALAEYNAGIINDGLLHDAADAWVQAYRSACMAHLADRETFTMTYTLNEYHYTLYYYDQAGNLVKTVPPAGVNLDLASDYTDDDGTALSFTPATLVAATTARRHGDLGADYIRTKHSMVSWYRFNSFQTPVQQSMPDGGITDYFYDKQGRLVASQNPIQKVSGPAHLYSYTLYDDLGRIKEVGQMKADAAADPLDADLARAYDPVNNIYTDGFYTNDPNPQDYFHLTLVGREQLTRTYYTTALSETYAGDPDMDAIAAAFAPGAQNHLRNRVATTTFVETPQSWLTPSDKDYDQATHYSYDIHGNVNTQVQEIRDLKVLGQSFKRVDYDYDLLTGNVNAVHYQAGQWDEYHHRYRYDADNRLQEVRTSRDGRIWERDARYFYYAHGPLARTELGAKQVQGIDNYYTLQGWLKGVNSIPFDQASDPGTDGLTDTHDHPFTNDAYAYALNYYPGDFKPVVSNGVLPTEGGAHGSALSAKALYNGNIPGMLTLLQDDQGDALPLHANVYSYDKLNRIKSQSVFKGTSTASLGALADNNEYRAEFAYDHNGNFTIQDRNAHNAGGLNMDHLQYYYLRADGVTEYDAANPNPPADRTNQLGHVHELDGVSSYGDDLEDQSANNYHYDLMGRLDQDLSEGMSQGDLKWNLASTLWKIHRSNPPSGKAGLAFQYNPSGERAMKTVKPRTGVVLDPEEDWTTDYYVRDAQGNPLAIYYRTYAPNLGMPPNNYFDRLSMNEALTYGGGRVNVWNTPRSYQVSFSTSGYVTVGGEERFDSPIYGNLPNTANGQTSFPFVVSRLLGLKEFEMDNHLANVLSTITDRRLTVPSATDVDHYRVEEVSTNRYYPFGSPMPDPEVNAGAYRFGFEGQEKDNEINNTNATQFTFEYRMYDSRIGRFSTMDPLAWEFPFYSTYQFSSNSPILSVDLEGLESSYRLNYSEGSITIRNGIVLKEDLDKIKSHRFGFSQGGVQDHPAPGVQTQVKCIGCTTNNNHNTGTAWVWIVPGTMPITTTEMVDRKVQEMKEITIPGQPPRTETTPHTYTVQGLQSINPQTGQRESLASMGHSLNDPSLRKTFINYWFNNMNKLNVQGDVESIEFTSYTTNATFLAELTTAIQIKYGVVPKINFGVAPTPADILSNGIIASKEAKNIAGKPDQKMEIPVEKTISEPKTTTVPPIEDLDE